GFAGLRTRSGRRTADRRPSCAGRRRGAVGAAGVDRHPARLPGGAGPRARARLVRSGTVWWRRRRPSPRWLTRLGQPLRHRLAAGLFDQCTDWRRVARRGGAVAATGRATRRRTARPPRRGGAVRDVPARGAPGGPWTRFALADVVMDLLGGERTRAAGLS